jgi:hypothetical protein
MILTRTCPICKKETTLEIEDYQYEKWRRGEFAQDVFSSLSPADREVIISGLCHKCQDNFFDEDDD